MTSISAGHIILTPTQPVGSGRPQRGSNPGPPDQESRALPTKLPRPPSAYYTSIKLNNYVNKMLYKVYSPINGLIERQNKLSQIFITCYVYEEVNRLSPKNCEFSLIKIFLLMKNQLQVHCKKYSASVILYFHYHRYIETK